MKLISELVDYFAELLTAEQKNAAMQLGVIPSRERDEDYFEDQYDEEYDPYYDRDPYEEYELPAPDRRQGHASGKRRPPRRPAITAAKLAAAFRDLANAQSPNFSFRLFIELAETRDRNYLSDRTRRSECRDPIRRPRRSWRITDTRPWLPILSCWLSSRFSEMRSRPRSAGRR